MLRLVGIFLVAVVDDWIGKMSGGFGLLLMFAAKFWNNDVVPSSWLWFASVVALFIAFFNAWRKQHEELVKFRDDVPVLVVPPLGFYADTRRFVFTHTGTTGGVMNQRAFSWQEELQLSMLHLRLRNDTRTPLPTERSYARRASATVTAMNPDGQDLFEMHARWSDEPQPPQIGADKSITSILSVDFAVGQSREIDLCVLAKDGAVYGFNNDSYQHENLIDPRWHMPGDYHTLRIRVQGVLVDSTFALTFETKNGAFSNLRHTEIPRSGSMFSAFLPHIVQ